MTSTRPTLPSASPNAAGVVLALASLSVAGCGTGSGLAPADRPGAFDSVTEPGLCSIPVSEIFNGGPGKDGIPALSDPVPVSAHDETAEFLADTSRVIGIVVGDEAVAVPLNILWWHEIVNMTIGGRRLAVTHCPLTGSSLAFDRELLGGVEFGVSGLLYRNNLIMYDRARPESLWPQMSRGGRCGVANGTDLEMFPVVETTWLGWKSIQPTTTVVGSNTGWGRDYEEYPYGDYAVPTNRQLLFPIGTLDPRRPPKERVLGIPGDGGGAAYPFGELAAIGPRATVQEAGSVVFWDGHNESAVAYDTSVDGVALTFSAATGRYEDVETGSVWRFDGLATSGPMAGRRLEPIAEAYVAYWFAWASFHPNTSLWRAP